MFYLCETPDDVSKLMMPLLYVRVVSVDRLRVIGQPTRIICSTKHWGDDVQVCPYIISEALMLSHQGWATPRHDPFGLAPHNVRAVSVNSRDRQ